MGQKELSVTLFINIKGALDYISKTQLVAHMITLDIDGDLIRLIKLFFTG